MKVTEVRMHHRQRETPKRISHAIRIGLAVTMALGVGFCVGRYAAEAATPTATLAAETARIHVVEPGETVWDIARPVADEQGIDVREIVYQLQINNELDDDCTLTPGQKIVIR